MLDLGWPELLVIAIVLIVVVGPKDLPRVLRGFGRTTTKLRSMAGDFRKQFDEALREAELDEVKGLVDGARKLDPRSEIRKHLNPLEKAGRDIRSGLDAAMKPGVKAPESSDALAKPAEPRKAGATEMPGDTAKAAKTKEAAVPKPAAAAATSGTKAAPGAKKATPAKTAARKKKTTGTAS